MTIAPVDLIPAPPNSRGAALNVIEVDRLSYRYGRVEALRDVTFAVPQGALYALLGPNGSGKTTLLQILMGLRRPRSGSVSLMGVPSGELTMGGRSQIGYVAEGQRLPGWMRLEQLEAYLAPLYATWDAGLARTLRDRFALDPKRKIRALSRGERMKAALLCALAPRPRLFIMDEPFSGMDVIVRDELSRGLLESAGSEGWTVLLCSHDVGEVELLADWVGLLDRGALRLSEPMDVVRERFKRVELTVSDAARVSSPPPDWMSVERAGSRLSFVVSQTSDDVVRRAVAQHVPDVTHVDLRPATLREVFVALAGGPRTTTIGQEIAA